MRISNGVSVLCIVNFCTVVHHNCVDAESVKSYTFSFYLHGAFPVFVKSLKKETFKIHDSE